MQGVEELRTVSPKSILGLPSLFAALVGGALLLGCAAACASQAVPGSTTKRSTAHSIDGLNRKPVSNSAEIRKVVESALEQTQQTFEYDASYTKISYPGGDVPIDRGVCADVVIRALRGAGVDLQREVHEDMSRNFSIYPNRWGLHKPDPNIDHRRVPNLMTFFERKSKSVPITRKPADYLPGDIVAWELDNKLLHIGVVTDAVGESSQCYLVVHNIGEGAKLEDVLMAWKIVGHYRIWN